MTLALLFWILMLLWLVLGSVPYFGKEKPAWSGIIAYAAVFVLGCAEFGWPIK